MVYDACSRRMGADKSRGGLVQRALSVILLSIWLGGLVGSPAFAQDLEEYFEPLNRDDIQKEVANAVVVVIVNPGDEIRVLADPSLQPRQLEESEVLVPDELDARGATRAVLLFNEASTTVQNCWTHFGVKSCASVTAQ
jgi:hypothetical protein